MNLEELKEALDEILPEGYEIEFDEDERLVIRTNLVDEDDELVPFDLNEDEDEEDVDEDDDSSYEEDSCDDDY